MAVDEDADGTDDELGRFDPLKCLPPSISLRTEALFARGEPRDELEGVLRRAVFAAVVIGTPSRLPKSSKASAALR